jgi:ComF family protein
MHQELFKLVSQKISRVLQVAMDHLIAPPFCSYCKDFLSERAILCIECQEKIDPIVSVQIPITKTYKLTVLAISDYQEPLKSLILAKSRGDIVVSRQLGHLIWDHTYFKHMPCDYIVPVPLHWLRYAKRGYNQAEEIATVLAEYRSVPVEGIIKRTKHTSFQSSLSYEMRLPNVKEAFALNTSNYERYHNKHLVLVDDLMTTGSTLASCAKIMLQLKPASITAVVVCRVC